MMEHAQETEREANDHGWAPTEPCIGCGHPYNLHVDGGGCAYGEDHGEGAANCDCQMFMAAVHPDDPHAVEHSPSPQGVLLLADNIEAMRMTFASLLGTWHQHDEPEEVAKLLAEAGVSPTGVADSLENAVSNMAAVIEALS